MNTAMLDFACGKFNQAQRIPNNIRHNQIMEFCYGGN